MIRLIVIALIATLFSICASAQTITDSFPFKALHIYYASEGGTQTSKFFFTKENLPTPERIPDANGKYGNTVRWEAFERLPLTYTSDTTFNKGGYNFSMHGVGKDSMVLFIDPNRSVDLLYAAILPPVEYYEPIVLVLQSNGNYIAKIHFDKKETRPTYILVLRR